MVHAHNAPVLLCAVVSREAAIASRRAVCHYTGGLINSCNSNKTDRVSSSVDRDDSPDYVAAITHAVTSHFGRSTDRNSDTTIIKQRLAWGINGIPQSAR